MTTKRRKTMDRMNPLHHLTFVQHANAVRLCVEGLQIYFTYREHGGKENALAAAIRYRNTIPDKNIFSKNNPRKTSVGASGVVGVAVESKNGEQVGWRAAWQEGQPGDRRQRMKAFYYSTHGKMALVRAIEYRNLMVKIHTPWIFSDSVCNAS